MRYLLIAGLLATPAAFFGYSIFNRATGIDGAIRQIGFYPINPPSTLRNPGAIYHISPDGQWYSALCDIDEDTLRLSRRESATERRIASDLTNIKIKIDNEIVQNQKTEASSDLVKSITYSLDDVVVYEISLDTLAEIAQKLQDQKASCKRVVEQYLRSGSYVCQIQQVMRATTAYKIDDKNNVDNKFDVRDLFRFIQGNIEGSAEIKNSTVVSGNQLFYGMRPAPKCLALPDQPLPDAPVNWLNRFKNKPLGLGYF